jgi:hypothetical protein
VLPDHSAGFGASARLLYRLPRDPSLRQDGAGAPRSLEGRVPVPQRNAATPRLHCSAGVLGVLAPRDINALESRAESWGETSLRSLGSLALRLLTGAAGAGRPATQERDGHRVCVGGRARLRRVEATLPSSASRGRGHARARGRIRPRTARLPTTALVDSPRWPT